MLKGETRITTGRMRKIQQSKVIELDDYVTNLVTAVNKSQEEFQTALDNYNTVYLELLGMVS